MTMRNSIVLLIGLTVTVAVLHAKNQSAPQPTAGRTATMQMIKTALLIHPNAWACA